MAGSMTYSGGAFKIMSGAYQTPTVYFNENNLMSGVSIQTKVSNRERFNTVSGTYTSPINEGQPSDYPPVKNATYIAEDLQPITKQIDLPMTQRPHMAQRIAKLNLELARQEITIIINPKGRHESETDIQMGGRLPGSLACVRGRPRAGAAAGGHSWRHHATGGCG
jgi:hypothetical protein